MKHRLYSVALTLALLVTLIPAALALPPTLIVSMKLNSPWCVVGEEIRQLDTASAAVTPIAENNRTLVPVSPIVEAFGGASYWIADTGSVVFTLGENKVALQIGSAAIQVNGVDATMDVPAKSLNNRTYVPMRAVLEGLGLTVEYDTAAKIAVVANGALNKSALAALPQMKKLIEKTASAVPVNTDPNGPATAHTQQTYSLASGKVTANVITVNMANPNVRVKAAISGGRLNATQSFADIVTSAKATAVINANYFEAYKAIKDPIGHVMVNGQFVYATSGLSSLGITDSGEMRYGRPAVFTRVKTADDGAAQQWAAFEVNVLKQFKNQAVLYTPARGASFPVTYPGAVLTAENGVSTAYRTVAAGESVAIPANGFVLYSSTEVTTTDYYRTPELGRKLVLEPYLYKADEEGFTLDGVQTIVSGAPRLVKDGAIVTYLEPDFATDARFTSNVSPRTAIGSTATGKLLLVNTSAASIKQMRELMLKLGCVDAINLDGGGSVGMYHGGKTISSPGRQLVTTLQIFTDTP